MFNESIFFSQTSIIALFALLAVRLGQSALVAFISLLSVLSNLFILKQIRLFGFASTCCDAYTVGAVLGLNLLQEYYGKGIAQRAIVISLLLLVFYTSMTGIQLLYIPDGQDTAHVAFRYLLMAAPRITVASIFVYFLVQYFDSLLYAKLRDYMQGKYLVARIWVSLSLTQFLDTLLFSFLGLYGIFDDLLQLVCISYTIKMVAILLVTPFVAVSKWVYDGKF